MERRESRFGDLLTYSAIFTHMRALEERLGEVADRLHESRGFVSLLAAWRFRAERNLYGASRKEKRRILRNELRELEDVLQGIVHDVQLLEGFDKGLREDILLLQEKLKRAEERLTPIDA